MSDELRRTALFQWHIDNAAKMAPFAGWQMPIQYGAGAIAEHRLVRRSAGIFDVSHMGQFEFTGPGATGFLDTVLSSNAGKLATGESAYGLLCRPNGTVVDDVFIYRLEGRWMMVVNASNREKDHRWLTEHLPDSGVTLIDLSDKMAMFALQGPRAIQIADLVFGPDAHDIARFASAGFEVDGIDVLVGRTGYTGEDGVELFVDETAAGEIWTRILETAARHDLECGPVGLAARDSLRFEPGFALYGHELDDETTPVEGRLTWACDMEKEFIGRSVIQQQIDNGVLRKLATIQLTDRGVPRQGNEILHDGKKVGVVVSGMYAPTVDGYFANVFVPPALAKVGTNMEIEIRGRRKGVIVVRRPLYKPSYRS